jgi:hypothetical protein
MNPTESFEKKDRTGGVADAQPPATGFYPSRILVALQNTKQKTLSRIRNE